MIDKTKSPHGIFFLATMKHPEAARSFFQTYLKRTKLAQLQELIQAIDWDNLTFLDKVIPTGSKKHLYANITYHAFTKLFIPKADVYLHGLLHMEQEQEHDMDQPTLERTFVKHFEQSNKAILRYHEEHGHDRQPVILNCVLSNRSVPDSDKPILFN
jgi:hypothetical protein